MLNYYLSVNNAEISHFRFHTRCSNCEKNKGLKTNKNRVRSGGKMINSFPQWTTSVKENIRCNNTAGMESSAGE